ncbi:MAG: riboflavin kinase [bacterium]|nr:riboflavin kinase [bacterium]
MNRTLRGTVVHGQGLGHRFGFPTANLKVEAGTALPPRGVYASEAVIDGRRYAGVTNIGARPTVTDSPEVTIETFFIDYEGDLYGRELEVSLRAFLRGIRHFDSMEALKAQIDRDKVRAEELLRNEE